MVEPEKKRIILKGKTAVFIDWANVHGWEESLKIKIDIQKLYEYLSSYQEITDINLYFGTDNHPKSQEFLKKAEETGYKVITKSVKYILVAKVKGENIFKRKCDFDMEVCIGAHKKLAEGFESFVFFTGDGDYEPLYKLLIEHQKQVIVIFAKGHLGREIWSIKKGLFKAQLTNLIDI